MITCLQFCGALAMKAYIPVCSTLGLALGLLGLGEGHGEVGCFVVEVTDQEQTSTGGELITSGVLPRSKGKAPKGTPESAAIPSLDDQRTPRVKAFVSGQSMDVYCGGVRIVEGDETGRYHQRK